MYFVYLLAFVSAVLFILMQMFKFSIIHRNFPKMIPVLILYGGLVAYLFNIFKFQESFITATLAMTVYLYTNYLKAKKTYTSGFQPPEGSGIKPQVAISPMKTLRFLLLSSLTFIVAFSVAFIVVFN